MNQPLVTWITYCVHTAKEGNARRSKSDFYVAGLAIIKFREAKDA